MTYPMYQWAKDLFPIHRSLTGEGVRATLRYIGQLLENLKQFEVPSGTKAFDWTVPKEWVCRDAYVLDAGGQSVIDIRNSNLHVVQYSVPVVCGVTLAELEERLHSLPDQPDAIPYVTSYYKETWGFCVSQKQREALRKNRHANLPFAIGIESELKDGHLTYGELIIPGQEKSEVLLSTYICHPSMANNELSGPVLVTALAQWLASKPRRHTYRILFLPETIGALVYLSRHLEHLKRHVIAGYQVTCVGDKRDWGYLPSRKGDTLADRAAIAAMVGMGINPKLWSFAQDRGSDERQWCAPGVDLPVGCITRSKFDTYPEYHTSLDNLDLISQEALEGSLAVYQRAIEIIEANRVYKTTTIGEPQLGKRGLYPSESTRETFAQVKDILNVLAYADGRDLIDLAQAINLDVLETSAIAEKLREHGLLKHDGHF